MDGDMSSLDALPRGRLHGGLHAGREPSVAVKSRIRRATEGVRMARKNLPVEEVLQGPNSSSTRRPGNDAERTGVLRLFKCRAVSCRQASRRERVEGRPDVLYSREGSPAGSRPAANMGAVNKRSPEGAENYRRGTPVGEMGAGLHSHNIPGVWRRGGRYEGESRRCLHPDATAVLTRFVGTNPARIDAGFHYDAPLSGGS